MADIQQIMRTIHDLSRDEKLAIRAALEVELEVGTENAAPRRGSSELVGLFAGEDELLDEVMQSIYEHRRQPLRVD